MTPTITLNARNASIEVSSKVLFTSTDFLKLITEKEVILSIPQKLKKEFKLQAKLLMKELKSTLSLIMSSPKLSQLRMKTFAFLPFSFLDTSGLPPEVVTLASSLIHGLLGFLIIAAMVTYILSAFLPLINKPDDAKKWQKNIRRGVVQGLIAVPLILLIGFLVEYFLGGMPHIPIFRPQ